jgi:hypothetical protein
MAHRIRRVAIPARPLLAPAPTPPGGRGLFGGGGLGLSGGGSGPADSAAARHTPGRPPGFAVDLDCGFPRQGASACPAPTPQPAASTAHWQGIAALP